MATSNRNRWRAMSSTDILAGTLVATAAKRLCQDGRCILIGWSTHKFVETAKRSDRSAAGSGGRTAFYLLEAEPVSADSLQRRMQQAPGSVIKDCKVETLAKVYHTTMRWLGRQSASTRLLAIQIAPCPDVIQELFASWQYMCVSNPPQWHWCQEAAAQAEAKLRMEAAHAEALALDDSGESDTDTDGMHSD